MIREDMGQGYSNPHQTASPARDGNVAIREEYEAAVKLGTVEAYELFIKRHPEHELAAKAREQIGKMRKTGE